MKKKTGFTLVELSFSVVFVGILALMVVFVSLNMTNIYRRGMTIKEINTLGNSLISDFHSALLSSSAKNLQDACEVNYAYASSFNNNGVTSIQLSKSQSDCSSDDGYSLVYNVRRGDVTTKTGEKKTNIPLSGAFCSGVYSYVWNSGYFFDSNNKISNNGRAANLTYFSADTNSVVTVTAPRLVRIADPSRQVCFSKMEDYVAINSAASTRYVQNSSSNFMNYMKNSYDYNISDSKYSKIYGGTIELLSSDSNNNLALYDLHLFRPAQSEYSRNIFFAGSFILASVEGGIDITAKSNYCAVPDDYENENFNYCSINKFNFAVQASGE